MPNILDRYILRQIALPALGAMAVITFLAVVARIAGYAEEMPLELLTARDVSRLSILFLPRLVSIVLLATLLLGIMLGFGKLAQRDEITAIKAAGVPLKRLIVPVLILGAITSGLIFFIQERVQPWTIRQAFDLIYYELPQRATIDRLEPGVMHQYEDLQVYFQRKDPDTRTLYGLVLVRPDTGGASVFQAEEAHLMRREGGYELLLRDGHWFPPDDRGADFDQLQLNIAGPSPGDIRGARQGLTLRQLIESEAALAAQYEADESGVIKEELRKERSEIAHRLAMPFAALAVVVVGAPVGVRARRAGASYAFAAGLLIIAGYYAIQVGLEPKVLRSMSTHILNAWVPNLVLFLAGVILIWRVDRV
ncbi:MAG: LptF/LptG family permease [Candidatus Hydrogenedentales bacterium]